MSQSTPRTKWSGLHLLQCTPVLPEPLPWPCSTPVPPFHGNRLLQHPKSRVQSSELALHTPVLLGWKTSASLFGSPTPRFAEGLLNSCELRPASEDRDGPSSDPGEDSVQSPSATSWRGAGTAPPWNSGPGDRGGDLI